MVSRHHLIAWARITDQARVVAVADPSQTTPRAARPNSGFRTPTQRRSDAGGDELDAVDIAAPREMHAPLVRLAARKRLPVLCQKPLAPTLQEATDLAAQVERSDAPDGARELALPRLLPRRRGMAARGPHRQYQSRRNSRC